MISGKPFRFRVEKAARSFWLLGCKRALDFVQNIYVFIWKTQYERQIGFYKARLKNMRELSAQPGARLQPMTRYERARGLWPGPAAPWPTAGQHLAPLGWEGHLLCNLHFSHHLPARLAHLGHLVFHRVCFILAT